MFASKSSTPSFIRSLVVATGTIATVVAIGAFGTGCASTTPDVQVISAAHADRHADSRIAHFDRESAEYRLF